MFVKILSKPDTLQREYENRYLTLLMLFIPVEVMLLLGVVLLMLLLIRHGTVSYLV